MQSSEKPAVFTAPKVQVAPDQVWRDLQTWVQANGTEIVIALAAGLVVYLGLSLARSVFARLKDKPGAPLGFRALVGRAASRTTQLFLMLAAAKLVGGYADPPAPLARTIDFLFTIVAAFQAAVWLREVVLGLIERRTAEEGQGETLANAMGIIRLLVTVAIFAVAVIVVLDNVGVNVTALVAGLGIGGIAIGLAAQGIFSDLFAALSIIFDKPFRMGETINYDTTTATVEKIGLKSTRLRAISGERKIISNANLLQKEITSYQTLDHRRLKFAIGVIYQTDPDLAARIPDVLRGIVEAEGASFVRSGFVGFGASSLDFEVEFDVYRPDWEEIYAIRHRIGLAILRRFNAEGLEFAYPTQTTFTAAPDGRMILPYPEGGFAVAPAPAPDDGARR
ncbi:small-conductance mechanosensitive channel [Phenylobacterium zucineum HLK1]|uniref:Small-conductance mechanosensitive channel n=1 Tax=Phenylobacterium zucineum (strain HLK1) TaxID=450851 RepID=B4REN3_PHEZH|nr:mechanosensitive ion channel domain-containing protein [Phenylobacterium zucineum]ACG78559.1 small-conductance mechanosensitive channel [Phenylobacterium zucineum HLK1]